MSFLANASTLPPPLPESEWIGKSELNYTALHQKLAEPLGCLKIPMGVLGFYVYLALHVVSINSIYQAVRAHKKLEKTSHPEGSQVGFIGSCLTFAFSLLILIDSCSTAHACSLKYGNLGISNLMGIIWSSLTQVASLFGLLGSVPCFSTDVRIGLWTFAILAYGCSWFVNLAPGFIMSAGIFQEGGVVRAHNVNFFRWLDAVKLNATLVSEIPAMLLAAAVVVWGVLYYAHTANGATKTAKRIAKYTLACAVYVFILFWTGAAYVSLGQIFGSPWGTWWVVQKMGKLYAAWIAVFSFFLTMLSLGGLGG
ncbi:hypothetical protein BU26DRAFT_499536 [Trematosphaeria pertusa]|uniref:Uncharacterized protein n=1 Tax=Trematosphaeria pertusa TaxID=390896 RepID=A0A6A6J2U3_9PLEO|nr:uncharacterized protein BU26DRAFT_499536 [Trematosphaeria pertusa]KAF2256946.1 hypothetical protein BU26DRAFT_499536 [Trematosphaeria pertusa]